MQVYPAGKYEIVKGIGHIADLTTNDIKKHLTEMKHVYDTTRTMSPLDMYSYFRTLESAYMNNPSTNNFAATVHQLHPEKYVSDFRVDGVQETISFLWSLSGMLKCPSCFLSLPIETAYNVHILNSETVCSLCSTPITYELLTVSALEHRWNINKRYIDPQHIPVVSNNYCYEDNNYY